MVDVQETKNALWRREEQLRRWNQSDTNKESPEPRKCDNIKVKFEDSYVFLAACSSGDKEEVENLLKKGADINTANIDGLTALHQACIDDNLEMVQFLVEHGAAIDAADNEGWTALHATASCGFLDVARYLLEKGASIAAVNNDGELALDLAEGDDMEDLLQEDMDKQGIDADAAREEESKMMLNDANQWLTTKYDEQPHAKTGATSLHCAAAKGYCDVIEVLLQAGADIDAKDFDGWTPLQAAAHWGQEDACKLLVENFCNMEHANKSGQTVFDLVDPDLEDTLRQLKERQALLRQDKDLMKDLTTRGGGPALRRSSVTRMSVDQKQNVNRSNVEEEREIMRNKVVEEDRKSSESSEAEETSSTAESSSDSETEKKNAINRQTSLSTKHQVNGAPISTTLPTATTTTTTGTPLTKDSDNDKPIRTVPESPAPKIEDSKEIKPPPPKPFAPPSSTIPTPRIQDLAKTERLQKEADKENEKLTERNSNRFSLLEKTDISKKVDVKKEDKREDKLAETENSKGRPISALSGDSLETKNRSYAPPVRDEEKEVERKARARKARETRRSTQGVTREEIEAAEQTLKDADRKPNTESRTDDRSDKENKPDDTSSSLLRRKHDDKSSTDENSTYTRRSYRDSALTSDSYNIGPSYSRSLRASGPIGTSNNSISSTSTATTAAPSSGGSLHSLSSAVTAVSPTSSLTSTTSSSTSSSGLSTTSSTAPYRSSYRSKYMGSSCDTDDKKDIKTDDKSIKEKDKDTSVLDKDSPSLKSSAIRSRKKRESRRGTGKITLEDIQAAKTDGETEVKEKESAKEETSRYPSSSRFSDISSSSLYDTTGTSRYSSSRDRPSSYHSSSGYSRSQSSTSLPDKDIDYKRLYEEQKAENEKLRKDIKKAQQELSDTKLDLEKLRMKSEPSRGTETAAERKEKRTLERKISELEEELRQMENLKADNQRLKEENGALIRVISKLSK